MEQTHRRMQKAAGNAALTLLLLLFLFAFVTRVSAQDERGRFGGTWTLDAAPAAGEAPGTAFLALWAPDLNDFRVPVSALKGLSAGAASSNTPVAFTLHRDAGDFAFSGSFDGSKGRGSFAFEPAPSYKDLLAKRGIGAPTAAQQFTLARHDVSLALIDELARESYATPNVAALVRLGVSGADLNFLQSMDKLGYRFGTTDGLVHMANISITPQYIADANARRGRHLSTTELMAEKTAEWSRAGAAQPQGDNVTRTTERITERNANRNAERNADRNADRNAGRNADRNADRRDDVGNFDAPLHGHWVATPGRNGTTTLEVQWDDHTQWRRPIQPTDLQDVREGSFSMGTSDGPGVFAFTGSITGSNGSGEFRFTPNHTFAATLRALGVADVPSITDHDLENIAFGLISGTEIQAFMQAGLTPLTFSDVIDLSIRQVSPAYVRAVQQAGMADAHSVRGVIDLKMRGITIVPRARAGGS